MDCYFIMRDFAGRTSARSRPLHAFKPAGTLPTTSLEVSRKFILCIILEQDVPKKASHGLFLKRTANIAVDSVFILDKNTALRSAPERIDF